MVMAFRYYRPLKEAPPARAIIATLDSVRMMRVTRAFMAVPDYQPLTDSGATVVPPLRPSCSREHENRPDTMVGRLHYSLRLTLSAHFR
jgi:hypothetical protein